MGGNVDCRMSNGYNKAVTEKAKKRDGKKKTPFSRTSRTPSTYFTDRIYPAFLRTRTDIILLFFLFLAMLKFLFMFTTKLDILMWDEGSVYLYNGVNMLRNGLQSLDWGPLYSAWYFFLSLFVKDSLRLYYFNFGLMCILPVFCLYFFLRRIQCPPIVSFIAAYLFFLSGYYNVSVFYMSFSVSYFTLFVILISLIAATYTRSDEAYYLFVAFGILAALFARPEYILSYGLIFIIVATVLLKKYAFNRTGQDPFLRFSSAIFVLIMAASLLFLCDSFLSPANFRQWDAFGAHFTMNYYSWTHSKGIPWAESSVVMNDVFGKANNIGSAFHNNPTLFSRHVVTNLTGYLAGSLSSLLIIPPNLAYSTFRIPLTIFESSILLLFLIYLFWNIGAIRRNMDKKTGLRLLVFSAVLWPPSFVSSLIIYSDQRYWIVQKGIIIIILSFLASNILSKYKLFDRPRLSHYLVVGLLLLILTPNIATGHSLIFWKNNASQRKAYGSLIQVKRIELFRSLNIAKNVNMLSNSCYPVFLGKNYTWVPYWQLDRPFSRFIKEKDIGMVVADETMINSPQYMNDPDFRRFLKEPQKYGFIERGIPNSDFLPAMGFSFIRKDLLK